MRKGIQWLFLLLLFSLVFWQGAGASFATGGSLKVQMYNGNTMAESKNIFPMYKLTNTGKTAIDLAKVKIRYYYTIDGEKSQTSWCDWCTIGIKHVTGSFGKPANPFAGADTYFEQGFTSDAGLLQPGQSIEIHDRFAKTDMSNYQQGNDYSFNSTATTYADWDKIKVFIGDAGDAAPVTNHDYTHGGVWVNQPATIHLTAFGDSTRITTHYQIDNGTAKSGNTIYVMEDGIHTIAFWSVNAYGDSETPKKLTVKLDQTLPGISDLQPVDVASLTSKTPTLSASLSDNLSGINPDSIKLTLDGATVTGTYDVASGKVTYTPGANLTTGSHTWTVSVADLAGNQAQKASSVFNVVEPGSSTPPPTRPR